MAKLQPSIDYMAKDYESFRQLMLDRLSSTLPAWQERHAPDLGVTLVEALAYVADYLSYYQDAVATEAYLATARQRISVRRHARLLDYVLHEGCNARAWVHCCVNNGGPVRFEPGDLIFAATNERIGAELPLLSKKDLSVLPEASYEIFKPVDSEPIELDAGHNDFTVVGALEKDATTAQISLPAGVVLKAGTVLILMGRQAGADGAEICQAIALAEGVSAAKSGTTDSWIRWHFDDALLQGMVEPIVALGNIVLVDHGRWVSDKVSPAQDPAASAVSNSIKWRSGAGPLSGLSLTHRVPLAATAGSAAAMINQDPRQALPQISLTIGGTPWGHVRADLLESLPYDRHFCVEVDDDGRAWIRFGDGEGVGQRPRAKESVEADYRVGNGQAGNVPAGAISRLILEDTVSSNRSLILADLARVTVTNPMPGTGGTEPESAVTARLIAPGEMRVHQQRAISVEDYAEFARNVSGVANAAATITHEGARRVVRVAIDPKGWQILEEGKGEGEDMSLPDGTVKWTALKQHVLERLEVVRRINHDVMIAVPLYVELNIDLELSILTGYMPDVILNQARRKLVGIEDSRQQDPQEKPFFDPDNLTFGQPIYWSQLVACLHSIPGVASVKQCKFAREDTPTSEPPSRLINKIEIGPYEIAKRPIWGVRPAANLVVKVDKPQGANRP
ncbi:hypothetical protein [Mesorhizobium sp. M1348]|uniref:hypothetical protein n=1 Tax=unclassified Mesorhizobium TaxID=325217 RepID=UPI00333AD2EC